MKANRAAFPLAAMCRVLGLSPSGYYGWLRRPPSERSRRDEEVKVRIKGIWIESRRRVARGSTRRSWPTASGWAASGWRA